MEYNCEKIRFLSNFLVLSWKIVIPKENISIFDSSLLGRFSKKNDDIIEYCFASVKYNYIKIFAWDGTIFTSKYKFNKNVVEYKLNPNENSLECIINNVCNFTITGNWYLYQLYLMMNYVSYLPMKNLGVSARNIKVFIPTFGFGNFGIKTDDDDGVMNVRKYVYSIFADIRRIAAKTKKLLPLIENFMHSWYFCCHDDVETKIIMDNNMNSCNIIGAMGFSFQCDIIACISNMYINDEYGGNDDYWRLYNTYLKNHNVCTQYTQFKRGQFTTKSAYCNKKYFIFSHPPKYVNFRSVEEKEVVNISCIANLQDWCLATKKAFVETIIPILLYQCIFSHNDYDILKNLLYELYHSCK